MDNIESFIGKTIMTTLPFYGRIKVYVLNVNPYTRMAQILIQTPQGFQMIEVPYSDFSGIDLVTNNVILPFKWFGPGSNKPWFAPGASGNPIGPMKPPRPPGGNQPGPMKPPGPPGGNQPGPMKPPGPPGGNQPGPMKPPGPPGGNPPGPMKPPGPPGGKPPGQMKPREQEEDYDI